MEFEITTRYLGAEVSAGVEAIHSIVKCFKNKCVIVEQRDFVHDGSLTA
jgi:hypothetical protein